MLREGTVSGQYVGDSMAVLVTALELKALSRLNTQ